MRSQTIKNTPIVSGITVKKSKRGFSSSMEFLQPALETSISAAEAENIQRG